MIALDVMGGDYAPQAALAGAIAAARTGCAVALVGKQDLIEKALGELAGDYKSLPLDIIEAPEVIEMGQEPVMAIRTKKNSSLVRALQLQQEGKASATVSAGNTGALMVGATMILGRQQHIERPAIAGMLPSKKDGVLCVDLGANTDCKPHHLVQFALLGAAHLKQVKRLEKPRIGLLANGTEEGKGSQLVKEAYGLLKKECENFAGNIEPYDIFAHNIDLVVCDGFVGNILLKTVEAVNEFAHVTGIADWREQGGAQLLGVNGIVIVAHGRSNARAIEQALYRAHETVKKYEHTKRECYHGVV